MSENGDIVDMDVNEDIDNLAAESSTVRDGHIVLPPYLHARSDFDSDKKELKERKTINTIKAVCSSRGFFPEDIQPMKKRDGSFSCVRIKFRSHDANEKILQANFDNDGSGVGFDDRRPQRDGKIWTWKITPFIDKKLRTEKTEVTFDVKAL